MNKPNAKRPTRSRKAQIPKQAGEIAEQLKGEARRRGATGARVTLAQRRLRDTAIIASLAAGYTAKDLARDFDLTVRQVQRIQAARNATPSVLDKRPMELIEELLRGQRGLIADFEAMADYYRDSAPNVALGAKRSADECRARLADLLMALGKLPDNLELFRMESELARLGQLMLDALDDLAAGKLSAVEMRDRVKDLVGRRELPVIEGHTSSP